MPSAAARAGWIWCRRSPPASPAATRSSTASIPPFHLGALRRYFRYHIRAGSFALGDGQVSLRHVAHNQGVAAFFHCQLTRAVTDIAHTLVRPSYSYLAGYESGAVLDRHTDREQCEYSITMCIDATPEPEQQAPWPLHLDVTEGALRIWQNIGESLLYRGATCRTTATSCHLGRPIRRCSSTTSITTTPGRYRDGPRSGALRT